MQALPDGDSASPTRIREDLGMLDQAVDTGEDATW
jgi:hypothetical protein